MPTDASADKKMLSFTPSINPRHVIECAKWETGTDHDYERAEHR
jgi:hypothetical protein